ncbi:hypothetical protein [Methanopyrus sp.]
MIGEISEGISKKIGEIKKKIGKLKEELKKRLKKLSQKPAAWVLVALLIVALAGAAIYLGVRFKRK